MHVDDETIAVSISRSSGHRVILKSRSEYYHGQHSIYLHVIDACTIVDYWPGTFRYYDL
jgi:hypothetical protein